MSPKTPDASRRDGGPLDPVDLEAADWLVRHDRGLTPAQREEFKRWMAADAAHAPAYARLKQTWSLLDRVPAESLPSPLHRRRNGGWAAYALGAAAAVTLALVVFPTSRRSPAPIVQNTATPVGGFEKITLPDGSVVRLNTASAIEVAFTAIERRVTLARGEAGFEVAKDKTRPFVVRVGQIDVRAVGTAFNVRRHTAEVEVLVTEGTVEVNQAGEPAPPTASQSANPKRSATISPTILAAGQRVTVPISGSSVAVPVTVSVVAPEEAARALAWQDRRLEFSAEPLDRIVAEFNRYNRHQLSIADPRLGAMRFGGKFPANDFESLIRLLEANFGVVVERREHETVLRSGAGLPGAR